MYLRLLIAALVLFAATGFAQAAPTTPGPEPTPVPDVSPSPSSQVKGVWDYKTELELSDKQVVDLRGAAQAFEAVLSKAETKLKQLNEKLVGQLNEEAPLEQIKVTLEEIAAVQIEVRLADVRTLRTMNRILSAAQLARWHRIQQSAGDKR